MGISASQPLGDIPERCEIVGCDHGKIERASGVVGRGNQLLDYLPDARARICSR
jgi:hypothetical protein